MSGTDCPLTWPLEEPVSAEDREMGVTHRCVRPPGHGSEHRCHCGETVYVTKTGRVLTDADIQALADEAMTGYDIEHLRRAKSRRP